MNFKRKGPKSTRAGCLLCKPHKRQGTNYANRQRHSMNRRILDGKQQLREIRLRTSALLRRDFCCPQEKCGQPR